MAKCHIFQGKIMLPSFAILTPPISSKAAIGNRGFLVDLAREMEEVE